MTSQAVQELMNKTAEPSLHGVGRNASGVAFDTFVVTKVERIQNMPAWTHYNLKKELGEPHSSVFMDQPNPGKLKQPVRPLQTSLQTNKQPLHPTMIRFNIYIYIYK